MDVRISEKETMYQPSGNGAVEVLVDGIFDFFPVESTDDTGQVWIDNIEILDDFLTEEKDRVIFSVLRQRGQDPIKPSEGIPWAEMLLGEIPVPLLMQMIADAAIAESGYVNVGFETIVVDGVEQLSVTFNTVDISNAETGE